MPSPFSHVHPLPMEKFTSAAQHAQSSTYLCNCSSNGGETAIPNAVHSALYSRQARPTLIEQIQSAAPTK
ncbi:hypothetical protein HBI56_084840 [Parastagonospora nodorum]|nr:hypothetical protein HBH56_101720 [Parastagonospora nodorum]KAH3929146.1 hypothetical protein HBH54_128710 [Parastagonospora nodorum]KAH3951477.1 hypothetical protein HBH53_062700 [Parastagonospora nodorum]KAH3975688.1 hypothetical protein HBH52_124150 [Parastagonospora nodorum]KAH3978890.1 hypothetical protein HBH51_061090 [Parastagonospora nodorum]